MAMALSRCFWAPCTRSGDSLQLQSQRFLIGRPHVSMDPVRLQVSAQGTGSKKGLAVKTKKKKVEKSSTNKDDDDGEAVDIPDMAEWFKNKPPGFGVGKEYDTSLEDQIMVDIEQGEKDRAAAEAKKAEKKITGTNKDIKNNDQEKKPEPPHGIRVKVIHLPKKKNVGKDLRAAFKGVPGLLHIQPVEIGNKKTRDPVCKGAAFLTFSREKHALSFIEKFKARKVLFGKVERQLAFEVKGKVANQKQLVPRLEIKDADASSVAVSEDLVPVKSGSDNDGSASSELADNIVDVIIDSEGGKIVEVDEVHDSVADAILDESTDEDEEDTEEFESSLVGNSKAGELEGVEVIDELEYEDSGYSDEDDELSEDSGEFEDRSFVHGNTGAGGWENAKVINELEYEDSDYSDEDDELSEDSDEDDLSEDGESKDSEGDEVPLNLGEGQYLEIEISVPTRKDLGSDDSPEEILFSSEKRIRELDVKISELTKRFKRKKTPELEDKILRLREEKIELLEKRVLARIIAAREAHKARRAKKEEQKAAQEAMKKTGSRLRIDDKELKEVVSKYFSP